jgi:hypothetical protein
LGDEKERITMFELLQNLRKVLGRNSHTTCRKELLEIVNQSGKPSTDHSQWILPIRKRNMTNRGLGDIFDVSDLPDKTFSLDMNVRGTSLEANFFAEPTSSFNMISKGGRPKAMFLDVFSCSVNFMFCKMAHSDLKDAYQIFWESDEVPTVKC